MFWWTNKFPPEIHTALTLNRKILKILNLKIKRGLLTYKSDLTESSNKGIIFLDRKNSVV